MPARGLLRPPASRKTRDVFRRVVTPSLEDHHPGRLLVPVRSDRCLAARGGFSARRERPPLILSLTLERQPAKMGADRRVHMRQRGALRKGRAFSGRPSAWRCCAPPAILPDRGRTGALRESLRTTRRPWSTLGPVHGPRGRGSSDPATSDTGECIPVQKEGVNEVINWSRTSVTHFIACLYDILDVDTSSTSGATATGCAATPSSRGRSIRA